MTALAFGLIFAGVLMVWAGITGANLLETLRAVLSGKKPTKPTSS